MKKQRVYTLAAAINVAIVVGLVHPVAAGPREDFEAVATAIEATGQSETAARLRAAVHALSDEELESIYGEADLIGLAGGFMRTATRPNT